jgi:ATP-dependent RNA helicase SUPV3L1/SUV3
MPGVDPDALAQSLAPMASSGRTSLPIDQHIARDGYRVSGFRPCGDRVVRVDIVERLADMIRAAFIQPGAGSGPHGPNGFVVNGQMTSLTGCSGEAFSSILRSLGFESTVVKRSDLPPAQPASATPSGENVPATTAPEEPSQPETAPVEAETETTPEPSADLSVAPRTEGGIPPPEVVPVSDDTECLADGQVPRTPTSTEPESASIAVGADDRPMAAASEETVVLWRPVRRARSPKVSHPHGRRTRPGSAAPQASVAPPATDGVGSEAPVSPREHRPEKRLRWQPPGLNQEKGARSSPRPARPEGPRPDEDRRQSSANRGMARPKSGPATPPTAVAVDPNSPFAKLLELRTLLESQAKNRR